VLRRIILPLSLPGIGSGSLLVFSFTISAFITPALLGGNRISTVSTLIYQKFTFSVNWPVGATLVVVLLVLNLGVALLHARLFRED
jgi:putative spermidine/putrescine transport system permease protein